MKLIQVSKSKGPLKSLPQDFETSFRDPLPAFRGKPFWSWNGDLEKEELLRQLEVVKSMGMGGHFMHSRTGLKTPYLGEEWFDLITSCTEKSSELGMEGWIYDEDRWPSGSAGGLVTQEPTHRMRSILLTRFEAGEGIVWPVAEDFIEAHLASIGGLTLNAYEAIGRGSLETCPADRVVLVFHREIQLGHSWYNGGAYLDTMSREATEAFITATHEQYAAHCGDQLGRGIKGIFTDEPHRGFILCEGVQQPGASRSAESIPYTEGLLETFEERYGEALRGHLPELFYRYKGERLSGLKWRYVELLQTLFLENWAKPCREWCEERGMVLTGHVLHEDSLAAQVVPCGSVLRYYEEMTYPGIDILGRDNEAFWVAKQVVSIARQQAKPFVLSELYGCSGWQTDFADHKRIGDWQAFLGINFRCHHLSWYSMAGESKRDYPASIFHQSAWYREYKYVEDYFSRVHYLLAQGEPDCDVLVVHPVESLWAQMHIGWAKWLGSNCRDVDVLEEKFATLCNWLIGAQLDFDYGDEEQMGRLGSVEYEEGLPVFRLGAMRYRALVVGGMETMRASTLDLLREFKAGGGTVIFAGEAPMYLDAQRSEAPCALATSTGALPWERSVIVAAVRSASAQVLSVNGGRGEPGLISHVRRLDEGGFFVALVNTRTQPVSRVQLELPFSGILKELNCRDASSRTLPASVIGNEMTWSASFAALEEKVFHVETGAEELEGAEAHSEEPAESFQTVDGPFDYSLSEPNVMVLDTARFREDASPWSEPVDILNLDDALRERLGWTLRGGQMRQPWAESSKEKTGPLLELEFRFELRHVPEALDLLIEQPERWGITLNGEPVDVPEAAPWLIDLAFKRVTLPPKALERGLNRLRIKGRFRSDTDLEALYLLGPFGVFRDASAPASGFYLDELPGQLEIGDVTEQGLPFYGAGIVYHAPLPETCPKGRMLVSFPKFEGACISVARGEQRSIVGFPPFHTEIDVDEGNLSFEIILTRQNMFGPLHRIPLVESTTGPDSFRTTGEAFSPEPCLYPGGLLEAPRIHVNRDSTKAFRRVVK